MAMSNGVVSMVRRLAIIHIVVGALLIIFGIADCATIERDGGYVFSGSTSVLYGLWIGTWMCIAGGLGIPGSTPQRTRTRNCFAGVFMGFSITSALFGGTIIIAYTITIVYARYSYYYYEDEFVYDPINGWTSFKRYRDKRYPYDAKMGLAAVILLLGVIEVVTGIWVSVCLCMMKPCCTDSQQQTGASPGSTPGNALSQGVNGGSVAIPLQASGVTVQIRPFQAVGNHPQPVVATSRGGGFPPQYPKKP